MTRFSPAHIAQYQAHYATALLRPAPHRWQSVVEQVADEIGATSVLDYGCGPVAKLARYSALPIANYDPAVPAYAGEPVPADLVVCLHALEHVEPACVGAVLAHLWRLARVAALVVVALQPSTKCLPDGSPWHTCVQPAAWWAARLAPLGACEALPVLTDATREYACLVRRGAP